MYTAHGKVSSIVTHFSPIKAIGLSGLLHVDSSGGQLQA